MPIHLQKEIEKLKQQPLSLSAQVEENLRAAVRAVLNRDPVAATAVIDRDTEIDHNEVNVEEECLKILALHQPVAIDLRFIISMLKINHDLERIGDLAVSMAERVIEFCHHPKPGLEFDITGLADRVQAMLKQSLDAMINMDAGLARKVWMADDEVDRINREACEEVKASLQQHPDQIDALLSILSVSRNLERIGDHAANIAKDVIYLVEGVIVRHRGKEFAH